MLDLDEFINHNAEQKRKMLKVRQRVNIHIIAAGNLHLRIVKQLVIPNMNTDILLDFTVSWKISFNSSFS